MSLWTWDERCYSGRCTKKLFEFVQVRALILQVKYRANRDAINRPWLRTWRAAETVVDAYWDDELSLCPRWKSCIQIVKCVVIAKENEANGVTNVHFESREQLERMPTLERKASQPEMWLWWIHHVKELDRLSKRHETSPEHVVYEL